MNTQGHPAHTRGALYPVTGSPQRAHGYRIQGLRAWCTQPCKQTRYKHMKISDIQSLTGKTIKDVTLGAPESVHINFTDGTSIEVADTLRWADKPLRAHASDRGIVRRTRIRCVDGHSISVQASFTHYSQPRDNSFHNIWLYDAVEVGYPELPDGTAYGPAELEAYREHNSSVYPYTPIYVVAAFVHAHGGQLEGGDIDPNY